MSVTAAGSSINVQQAMVALRQSVQMEQVAASLLTQAAGQGANNAAQAQAEAHDGDADGRGEQVDVKA